MKLKECIHGVLVTDKDRNRVGMIVGITNNRPNQSLENRIGVEYPMQRKYFVSGFYEPLRGDSKPFNHWVVTDDPLSDRLIKEWQCKLQEKYGAIIVTIMNIIQMDTSA